MKNLPTRKYILIQPHGQSMQCHGVEGTIESEPEKSLSTESFVTHHKPLQSGSIIAVPISYWKLRGTIFKLRTDHKEITS